MRWRGFDGLIPYFGGKRKLAPRIFREIARVHPRETWSSLRLVDPFLGGGSVSLYAKAQGFGVLCGDIAERSFIIGRALIENDSVRLTRDDVLRLFTLPADHPHLLEEGWAPDHMPPDIARFLDGAFAAAEGVGDDAKRALLRLLLLKYLFWLRPHSKFSSPNAFNRPFVEGRWDDIKATYKHAIAANAAHPLEPLLALARDINRAVFPGAQRCRAVKGDALATIRAGEGAEVLYLDPPYGGTLAYEEEYRILDDLFGEPMEPSPYSSGDGLRRFGELLAECGSYPLWVISYGNALADLDEVRAMIEQFRPTRAVELAYAHLGAVASLAKREANREFILLAGEGVTE